MRQITNCTSDAIHQRAMEVINSTDIVLDIGCGVRPQQFIQPKFLICVEPFHEYRSILKRNLQDCDCIIIPTDAMTALNSLPNRSVDTVFLLDVIEHLTKEEGLRVISECERVARKQIVIYTPLGYMPQEIEDGQKDGWNLNGGSFQQHKSGWMPDDFPKYDIFVCEDLHKSNFRGQEMESVFGGFYAIRTQSNSADIKTNEKSIYQCIMQTQVYGANEIVNEILDVNSRKALLEAGIRSCQYHTERLISKDDSAPVGSLDIDVEAWRNEKRAALKETINLHFGTLERSRNGTAAALISYDAIEADLRRRELWVAERESQLSVHESNLNSWEKDVRRRETWIAEKETQLAAHENNLNSWENDVRRREGILVQSDAP